MAKYSLFRITIHYEDDPYGYIGEYKNRYELIFNSMKKRYNEKNYIEDYLAADTIENAKKKADILVGLYTVVRGKPLYMKLENLTMKNKNTEYGQWRWSGKKENGRYEMLKEVYTRRWKAN